MSNASAYDPYNGSKLSRVSGLCYHRLATQKNTYTIHIHSKVTWKPDIIFSSQKTLGQSAKTLKPEQGHLTNKLIDVGAQKNLNLKAVEVNMLPDDSTSTWLHEDIPNTLIRHLPLNIITHRLMHTL